MPTLKIKGAPPYDGEYAFPERLTNDDYHLVKEISGVRAGEMRAALAAGDVDVLVALVVIALQRAGIDVDRQLLGRAEPDAFDIEGDADPPPQPSEPPETRLSEPTGSSGTSGNGSGESHQVNPPNPTGAPDSGTGVTSDPATSAG